MNAKEDTIEQQQTDNSVAYQTSENTNGNENENETPVPECNGSTDVEHNNYSEGTYEQSITEELEENMANDSVTEMSINRNQNRNKNTSSSIFDGVMVPPVDTPRKKIVQRPTTLPADLIDSPTTTPFINNGTNNGSPSHKKHDGNPLTGEGYGPRDGHGIGAYHQHSNVPPGGFASDLWKSL